MNIIKKVLTFTLILGSVFLAYGLGNKTRDLVAQNEEINLNNEKLYFLGETNKVIDLNRINLHTKNGKLNFKDATLTLSDNLTRDGNTIKAQKNGVHEIIVKKNSINEKVYFVTKMKEDSSFTLYEEDFTGLTNLPDGYKKVSGNPKIVDEALYLNGINDTTTIVLLPDYLKVFSNYIISTDMKMVEASNETRWSSVMFRYNPGNYYQMAVRKNASLYNGVEFARSVNNQWSVDNTKNYKEALKDDIWYNLKIDVKDNVVKEYINDELLITENNAKEYLNGSIGFQTNAANTYFDNIKITMPQNYEPEISEIYPLANVYEPETGIVNPASVIVEINNLDDFNNSIKDIRPATLIMNLDRRLNIIDENEEIIFSFEEVIEKIKGKNIPAFRVDDYNVARSVSTYMKLHEIKDFFVVSKSEGIIKQARSTYNLARGIYDFTEEYKNKTITNKELIEIRNKTNLEEATIAIVPSNVITRSNVEYLQKRLITVWGYAKESTGDIYEKIVSGLNGIVASNFTKVFDIYKEFPENSVVRKSFMIGHRGIPSLKPENSIPGVKEAIDKGADIIELDLHLTLDNEIVVHHDFNTERLFNKKLEFPTSTLEEIQSLVYTGPNNDSGEEIFIPTFKEYIEALKDYNEDIVYFIEIKGWHGGDGIILELMRKVLEETNMMDRAVVIGFEDFQVRASRRVTPELSAGYLNYSGLFSPDKQLSVEKIIDLVVPEKTTFNPSYVGLNEQSIKALHHRGITVWPWTILENDLDKYFMYGVGGNTTDFAGKYYDKMINFELKKHTFDFYLNKQNNLDRFNANHYDYNNNSYEMVPEYKIIDDGNTGIEIDRGLVVGAKNTGVAKVLVYYTTNLNQTEEIVLYENIITINVLKEAKTTNLGLILGISIPLSLIAISTVTTIIIKKKGKGK